MPFRLPSLVAGALILSFLSACTPQQPRRIEFFPAPASGDVAAIVKSELDLGRAEKRRILVYVGATWCEPCKRFHHAVEAGKLDGRFPNLRLLDFDQDRDGERLRAAGYNSRLIPLFALPSSDGRSSQIQVEGSIKGDGAVDEIVPRLNALLAAK
jgi:thiol-disulfide isomerase/thioredoxin